MALTAQKAHFNNKESVINNFTEVLVDLMPQHGSMATQIRSEFLKACLP